MVIGYGQRSTRHVRRRQASAFFKAAKFAEEHGPPLNLLVTLNLSHTACPAEYADMATRIICQKFGRWLRHQSKKALQSGGSGYGPPRYQRVIEAPDDIHHVHWLVSVPPSLQALFEKVLPKWLLKVAGSIHQPAGLIDIKPIDSVMAASRYCMKGVEPNHARRCFVRPQPQGVVVGQRVAISRSLSRAARRAAGWRA